jgi:hypothetical protein
VPDFAATTIERVVSGAQTFKVSQGLKITSAP